MKDKIQKAAKLYEINTDDVRQSDGFIEGDNSEAAKEYWQQGMYSEEEVKIILKKLLSIDCSFIKECGDFCIIENDKDYTFEEWFNSNKKK